MDRCALFDRPRYGEKIGMRSKDEGSTLNYYRRAGEDEKEGILTMPPQSICVLK